MPVDVLNEGVVSVPKQGYPDVTDVHLANTVSCSGIQYSEGMHIVHGSADGLP